MPPSRPGAAGGNLRRALVGHRRYGIGLLLLVTLVVGACGAPATSAVEETPVVTDPATGSNEGFQATEAAAASADTDDDAPAEPESDPRFPPAPGGYLVWAHPVEPAGLAVADQVNGGLYTTSWIREGVLEGLYRVDADRVYQPELLAADAVVTANDNGMVTIDYRLRSGLQWSDGEPLTAEDVAYTHEILMEGCLREADGSAIDVSEEGCVYPLRDRTGYDLVTDFTIVDDTRFSVRMAAFYPDWRSLYPHVFAAHAFGEDAATVAARLDGLASGAASPSAALPWSGPLTIERWGEGSLVLAVNGMYHGAPDGVSGEVEPLIGGVQVNFVGSPAVALQMVADGEADVTMTGPSTDVVSGLPGAQAVAVPALEFEHLGLNLLDPHLADPLVRQAVVAAVDRADLATIYGPFVGQGVSAEGVGNVYWLPGQGGYEDHQPEAAAADEASVAELLEAAGYTVAAAGGYSHPDRGPLRLRLLTNGGDSIRMDLLARLANQLEAANFEVEGVERNGGAFLTDGPFSDAALAAAHSGGSSGDADVWDMVLFAWAGGPWPGLQSGAFRSQSGANPYGYGNPEFDTESSRCDGLVDDSERTICYQELDTYITTLTHGDSGLVVVPLIERPQFVVYNPGRLAELPLILDGPTGGPLAVVDGYVLAGAE